MLSSDGTAAASDGASSTAEAGTEQVVTMATHTISDMGSCSTQPTGLCQLPVQQQPVTQNCHTGEDPDRATKYLPIQRSMSAPDRNMTVPSVSVPMMAGLQNPVSTAVPSTGMDMQYGSSDLAAQMEGSSNLLQQAQDGIFWIQLPQFVPSDQQMFLPGSQFVQQPAATADAPGQQAQDAVTMAMAMWKMMNSVLQQKQHMAYPGYGPQTPRTGLYQTAGTPVGTPRCPGLVGTPRFPAPTQVHNTLPGTDHDSGSYC